jgi:D-glycero-D-manno-heptose 1,7-bisphosphate phosphatase
VVTNQSGIARNFVDEAAMHAIHDRIQDDLAEKLDGFYFCPHLPDEGCACRKPNLGMIEAACVDFEIDLENSWMIGDKEIDVQTGINAGIRTAMVLTGYGTKHVDKLTQKPDVVAENLLLAVKAIINEASH